jgi:hypothetical protein
MPRPDVILVSGIPVSGGLPGAGNGMGRRYEIARSGDQIWHRHAGEERTAFITRVMEEAEALGLRRIVVGDREAV